jgi:nicotinamidase-related amidase
MTGPTALLVIDPQRVYTDPRSELHCSDADETISRINRLVNLLRNNLRVERDKLEAEGSRFGVQFCD